jgi:hypothetical protein
MVSMSEISRRAPSRLGTLNRPRLPRPRPPIQTGGWVKFKPLVTLDPFPPAGHDRERRLWVGDDPLLVLDLEHALLSRASENDHGSTNDTSFAAAD